ncbi:uncharacterized protein SPSK_01554 [Sporothrix schenckii 1099-18]|uniref:Carboxylesterase type B domain-containing protein n=1 Tax=Sporothrix schenckii 1099-18 TaxID=1397361 RepID=A0A0F2MB37_SPOSC|nr:uncharacterized protein SPSK_01554 [Sporothrix schenckii 1099-18]KJR86857.1 hypothetical protein SPSK_01554 [Sporothrix schenckii 1099-18]
MMILAIPVCLLAVLSFAQATAARLPILNLPWGTWQSTVYEKDSNVYVFKNVRFGAKPPRFGRSAFPTQWDNSSSGAACYQVSASGLQVPHDGPVGVPDLRAPLEDLPQDEDCLFLDVYVPASNFDANGNPIKALPVVVWFYGGAFAFGAKELGDGISLYTGQAMNTATHNEVIFVAGNYRLGAFGWLAGRYMQSSGQPNAGLYDQALLLNWTNQYISRVGGNPNRVSAWGESAGAGSILHHLIREGGTVKPLFNTFLVQSPAFPWSWDNQPLGTLDETYLNFSQAAGCGRNFNITCLRNVNIDALINANDYLYHRVKDTGIYPVGPSVDGTWVQTIPALSFAYKQFYPAISGAIISHVYNESYSFTPNVRTQNDFDTFLAEFIPGPALATVRSQIRSRYNCVAAPYRGDFKLCLAAVIGDSSFFCNTRDLYGAFPSVSYMMQYAFPTEVEAVHASDLLPAFMNGIQDAVDIILNADPDFGEAKAYALATDLDESIKYVYQAYFGAFAASGNPNSGPPTRPFDWPVASPGESLSNVLRVQQYFPIFQRAFVLTTDKQNNATVCGFWTNIAYQIVNAKSADDSTTHVHQQPQTSNGAKYDEL